MAANIVLVGVGDLIWELGMVKNFAGVH